MYIFHKHGYEYKIIRKSKFFDKKWYLKTYPDIANSKTDPIEHYLTDGWQNGYNPSKNFDGNAYLTANMDVKNANINPLLHYEMYGKNEGRTGGYAIQYNINKIQKILYFIKHKISNIWYYKTIKRNQKSKILVVLHLFYMNAWDAIKLYLDNLDKYNYDLIVTIVRDNYQQDVLNKIKKYKNNTKFFVYQNQGFDIGPFIDILNKTDISKYDLIFKIHSKGISRKFIYIYDQIFKYKDWFYNLFDGILGAFSVHRAINAFSQDKKIGIVASKNLIVQDPEHKRDLTRQFTNKYKLQIKPDYHYIAGTCFIIRPKCLEQIINLKLTINSFSETQRNTFSLAHALERIICANAESQNFKIYGIPVFHHIYNKELKSARKTSALRLLDDKRIIFDSEFFYRLETRKITNYYIQYIPLKDINRRWYEKIIKLNECAPYKYLKGQRNTYINYCKENKKLFNIDMSLKRYNELINNIETNGFNPKNMPVINAKNNVIMDGQHRCCYLLNKYGPDYKVQAVFIDME